MNHKLFEHHTVSDWDFWDTASYDLYTGLYVSPPSSLRVFTPNVVIRNKHTLCRVATTLNLPQGRLVTAVYKTWDSQRLYYSFRNQAALGAGDHLNCYLVGITYSTWWIQRLVNGLLGWSDSQPNVATKNTWEYFRLTWWNGKTPAGVDALAATLEKYIAGEWVKQGEVVYDTGNQFKDSEINRCGPGIVGVEQGYPTYIDDTEIWGPE